MRSKQHGLGENQFKCCQTYQFLLALHASFNLELNFTCLAVEMQRLRKYTCQLPLLSKTRAKVLLLHWCLVKDPWATHTILASRWINLRCLITIGWFSQLMPPRPGKTFLMLFLVLRHSWDDFLWKNLKTPKARRHTKIPSHFSTAAIMDSQWCRN